MDAYSANKLIQLEQRVAALEEDNQIVAEVLKGLQDKGIIPKPQQDKK